jgi:hypothetical protein
MVPQWSPLIQTHPRGDYPILTIKEATSNGHGGLEEEQIEQDRGEST